MLVKNVLLETLVGCRFSTIRVAGTSCGNHIGPDSRVEDVQGLMLYIVDHHTQS